MRSVFRTRVGIIVISVLAAGVTLLAAIVTVPNSAAGALSLAGAIAVNPAVVTGASFLEVPPNGTPHAVANAPLSSFPTHLGVNVKEVVHR